MKKSGVIKAVITILIILLIVGAYYFFTTQRRTSVEDTVELTEIQSSLQRIWMPTIRQLRVRL